VSAQKNSLTVDDFSNDNSEGRDNDLASESNHASVSDEEHKEGGDHRIVPAIGVNSESSAPGIGRVEETNTVVQNTTNIVKEFVGADATMADPSINGVEGLDAARMDVTVVTDNVSPLSRSQVITYEVLQQNLQVPQEQLQHPAVLGTVTAGVSVSWDIEASGTQPETAGHGVQTLAGGRSKRQRVTARHNQLDEVNDSHFNDCLCGSVVTPASDGALMCKQLGCETQWVLISFNCGVIFSFIFLVPFKMYFT
jgi:hypothetical protein